MPQQELATVPATGSSQNRIGWVRSSDPAPSPVELPCWMVLSDGLGLGDQIVFQLRGAQKQAIKVTAGSRYRRISRFDYVIRPGVREDYLRLIRSVLKRGQAPTRIVHLWSLRAEGAATKLDDSLQLGLWSIPCILHELSSLHPGGTDIAVVSNALQADQNSVGHWFRDSVVRLHAALTSEFPQATCRSIDVDTSKQALAQIAVQLIREHSTEFADPVVAYCGDERWVERLADADSPANGSYAAAGSVRSDWQTREGVGSGAAAEIEDLLEGWWRELLMAERVSADDDFFDLGGDSIIAVQLFRKINSTFEVELGLSTIFDARTVRQMADLISQTKAESAPPARTSPSMVAVQPKGKLPRLHVISGLGGNVVKFQKLAFYLGEDQPVFGLLPRGLDGKEPYFTRVEDMAAYYADAIRDSQPVGPYQLIGYSFGGIVAFEVARQIVARGGEVSLLGVLDTAEPQYLDRIQKTLPARERYRADKDYLAEIMSSKDRIEHLRNLFATKISSLTFRLYRALGRSVPQDLGKIEYINLLAAMAYHPGQYSGKLTVFRCADRKASDGTDRALGWGEVAAQVEVVDLPCHHFNLLVEPNVRVLAEKMQAVISGHSSEAAVHMEVSRS